jgi:hypothetical protein
MSRAWSKPTNGWSLSGSRRAIAPGLRFPLLNTIRAQTNAAVVEEARERRPTFEHVVDRLGDLGMS